jgi:hypothetical protein
MRRFGIRAPLGEEVDAKFQVFVCGEFLDIFAGVLVLCWIQDSEKKEWDWKESA